MLKINKIFINTTCISLKNYTECNTPITKRSYTWFDLNYLKIFKMSSNTQRQKSNLQWPSGVIGR